MILGIGTDLVDKRRIQRSIERFGDRFLDRIFTDAERAEASTRVSASLYFALSFCGERDVPRQAREEHAPAESVIR